MGALNTFSKYAWIPYLFLCVGLVVLFGTEEWLLFHYKTPNELVVMQSKFYANQPIGTLLRETNFTILISNPNPFSIPLNPFFQSVSILQF